MVTVLAQHIIVHETRISTGTPWHIYIAAIAATVVAVAGWFVAHRTSQNRDLLNWRRTTLMQATIDFIATSEERNRIIVMNRDAWSADLGRQQMSLLANLKKYRDQIWLSGSNEQYQKAVSIIQMHTKDVLKGKLHSDEAIPLDAALDPTALNAEHDQLLHLTKNYLYSNEIKKTIKKQNKNAATPPNP